MNKPRDYKMIGKWDNKQESYGQGEAMLLLDIEESVYRIEKDNPGIVELRDALEREIRTWVENDIERKGLGIITKVVNTVSISFLKCKAAVWYSTSMHFDGE